jgi:serine/threonine protein phosphatase PrpC
VSSIIRIFCVKTRAGVNYDGTRKTNQDNFISKTNLLNLEDYHVFGVFDGHGLHGHFVSTAVKQFFTDYYNRIEIYSNRTHKFTKSTVKEAGVYERLKENNYEFLKTSFMRCEQELTKAKFEVNFSGTTCVLALLLGII